MRYFSTFSGIGGFELGIQSAYDHYCHSLASEHQEKEWKIKHTKEKPGDKGSLVHSVWGIHPTLDGLGNPLLDLSALKCVGYSEKDKFASAIYRYHFPQHQNFEDITTINPKELPDFDLLVGGFPCQAFSLAGNRRGFEDARGTLFFDLASDYPAKATMLSSP